MRMFWRQMRRFMQDTPSDIAREKAAKKKAALAFDSLEDRCTPANLVFSSAGLVDGSNNAIANPVTGERVAVKVNWISTGLTAADQYVVRATVGGIVFDSQSFTGGADGGYSTTLTGWYAGTGVTNYQVAIDPLDTVVETSNADNASGPQSFNAVGPATLPSKFQFPVNNLCL